MKIRTTLQLSDDLRRCIAVNLKNAGATYLQTRAGMATRATCVKWLEGVIKTADALADPQPKLDPLERAETVVAVAQLRSIGWPDSRIRLWLLKNAALMQGANLKLWEEPVLTAQ